MYNFRPSYLLLVVHEQGFILWLIHAVLCHLFADLRKFHSYKGGSVTDLLRAMRNKVSVHFNDYDKLCRVKQVSTVSITVCAPATETPLHTHLSHPEKAK